VKFYVLDNSVVFPNCIVVVSYNAVLKNNIRIKCFYNAVVYFVLLCRRQLVNLQDHTAYKRHLEHLEVCSVCVCVCLSVCLSVCLYVSASAKKLWV